MSLAHSRSLFFMAFVAGALALGVSWYLEFAVGLRPCGLCLLQRLCLALFSAVCLIAAVHGPGRGGSILYWLSAVCCSLTGTVAAWRQVLLQTDPVPRLTSCSTSLGDLIATEPWSSVIQQLFNGAVGCAQITWTLFGLSLTEWSLLLFVAMVMLGLHQLLRLVWRGHRRPLSGESSHRVLLGD
ncbi:disulfide bond formation protein B [Pseudomonas vancouverensis]|uniref:disulfide bond formation protein B n=1 Tax=Pseudomonas vancouverensis TaxID=95300 RepID=UPI003D094C39